MKNFSIEIDAEGVALVTFDVPGKGMNVISDEVQRELANVIETLRSSPQIRGAVLLSGKPSGFCAGADLGEFSGHLDRWRAALSQDELRQGLSESSSLSRHLRDLETCGKPVAAAIGGMALGGGFELALACHYRVAVDDPKLRLAFPEASVGLLPGAGGTQRLIRLLGIGAALPHLLEGKSIAPVDALAGGVLHALVPADALLDTARRWVLDQPQACAPWDEKDFKLPAGGPHSANGYRTFAPAMAALHARGAADYPALGNILKCVFEGSQVPFDTGLRIESRYFFNTLRSLQAKAMARTFFLSRQALAKRAEREDLSEYLAQLRQAVQVQQQAMLQEGLSAVLVNNLSRQTAISVDTLLTSTDVYQEEVVPQDTELLKRRLLYVQALAALRSLENGSVGDVLEADAGAIAAGFPGWTGGPISFVEVEGLDAFVAQAEAFAGQYGESFSVPAGLRELAASGRGLYA